MTKTIFVNDKDVKRTWYLIDAAGKPLGRVAASVAAVARGKNKAAFTPNQDCGDRVVVINADKVSVSGNKAQDKIYYKHTGFVGNLKRFTFEALNKRHPGKPLEIAIRGMLPHNRLGRLIFSNIKIYAGSEHPHTAQNPVPLAL